MKNFRFFKKNSQKDKAIEGKVFFIPANISSRENLFNIFSLEMELPFYFGRNWDAFYDCLADLHWIKDKKVWIIHEDIPLKNLQSDRKKYIEVLLDLIQEFDANSIPKLEVAFPVKNKSEINRLMKEN